MRLHHSSLEEIIKEYCEIKSMLNLTDDNKCELILTWGLVTVAMPFPYFEKVNEHKGFVPIREIEDICDEGIMQLAAGILKDERSK